MTVQLIEVVRQGRVNKGTSRKPETVLKKLE